MKIHRGNKTEDIPFKTPADFTNATKKPGMTTRVVSVDTPQDYASLVRLLSATVRPFAVAIIQVT